MSRSTLAVAHREIAQLLRELDEDGVEVGSEIERAAVSAWLNVETELTCRCGRTLRRFERLSRGICCGCMERLDDERSRTATAIEDRLEKLGVPARYRTYTLSSWRGVVPENLVAWARHPHGVCLLTGPTGTGKTHLAVVLLAIAEAESIWCQFSAARHVPRELMNENRVGNPDRPEWKRLTRPKLLLLDDLGAEPGTEWALDLLGGVLDHRHQNMRATLLTSNLSLAKLAASDRRIGSRISEDCLTHAMLGPDRRSA